jgi:hypothetical protein
LACTVGASGAPRKNKTGRFRRLTFNETHEASCVAATHASPRTRAIHGTTEGADGNVDWLLREGRGSLGRFVDGRLGEFGVRERVTPKTTDKAKCLTCGTQYVWLYADRKGFVKSLKEFAGHVPSTAESIETADFIVRMCKIASPFPCQDVRRRRGKIRARGSAQFSH